MKLRIFKAILCGEQSTASRIGCKTDLRLFYRGTFVLRT
jgi:hypothetical protein